jgi:hypothetical protein
MFLKKLMKGIFRNPFADKYDPYVDLQTQHEGLMGLLDQVREIRRVAIECEVNGRPIRDLFVKVQNVPGAVYWQLAHLEDVIAEMEIDQFGRIRSEMFTEKYQEPEWSEVIA